MKDMKFTILLGFSVLLLFTVYGIERVYVQKYFTEKAFDKYISAQGISSSNIEHKVIRQDQRRKSYFVEVSYKDDPGFLYDYHYNKFYKSSIRLVVYEYDTVNDGWVTPIKEGMKYPPLE